MALTNHDYIIKNMVFRKNGMGWWEASFTCADGYKYSICDNATGRVVKPRLRDQLLKRVMGQTDHPIQKVVRVTQKVIDKA